MVTVESYHCHDCCPELICISNCSNHSCPEPPHCPPEYVGRYPLTPTQIGFDNCACPIYGNCSCKNDTCLNPLTHAVMLPGQEVMSDDNCLKFNCTEMKNHLGCNLIEPIVNICQDECQGQYFTDLFYLI